jgi:hypothetical protein
MQDDDANKNQTHIHRSTMTTPTFVFEEDIFDVKDIDKEGKFFEKGTRIGTGFLCHRTLTHPIVQCHELNVDLKTMTLI